MTLAKAISSYWKAATMRTKHAGKSLPSQAAGLGYPYHDLNHGSTIVIPFVSQCEGGLLGSGLDFLKDVHHQVPPESVCSMPRLFAD